MNIFTRQDAEKEIRIFVKNLGLTFKKNGLKNDRGQILYDLIDRTKDLVLKNITLWMTYDNIQNGYLEKIATRHFILKKLQPKRI